LSLSAQPTKQDAPAVAPQATSPSGRIFADLELPEPSAAPSPQQDALLARHGVTPSPRPAPSSAADSSPAAPSAPEGVRPPAVGGEGASHLGRAREAAFSTEPGTPEHERAMRDYTRLRTGTEQLTEAAIAETKAERDEAIARKAYLPARAALGGLTFGIGSALLNEIEERTGTVITPESTDEQISVALAGFIGSVVSQQGLMKGLSGLAKARKMSKIGEFALRRLGGNALSQGTRQLSALASGQTDAKTAGRDFLLNYGSALLAMIPENVMPPGVANSVAQVLTDLTVDIVADKYRGRFKDQTFAHWFLTEELPNLAMSVAAAGEDLRNPRQLRAQQKAIRKLFDKHVKAADKSGEIGRVTQDDVEAAAQVEPTRPDPEAVTRASQELGAEESQARLQAEVDKAVLEEDITAPVREAGTADPARLAAQQEAEAALDVQPQRVEARIPQKPVAAMSKQELRAQADELGVAYKPNEPNQSVRAKVLTAAEERMAQSGAAISEDGQEVHGPRNITINRERAEMGLDPREDVVRKALPESYEGATARMDADPDAGRKLIAEMNAEARPHTDEEVGVMGIELVNRKHAWHKAIGEHAAAAEGPAKAEAFRQMQVAAGEYKETADAVQNAGTATARGLAARRMLIKDDLTLEDMRYERQAMKGGQLSKDEIDGIDKEFNGIEKARDAVADADKARAKNDVKRLIKSAKRSTKPPPTMEEALEALRENGAGRKQLRDLARAHVEGGVEDVTDLTLKLWENVRTETGAEISSTEIRETLSGYGRTSEVKGDVEKKLGELTTLSRLISGTEDALKGEAPKKTGAQRPKPTESVREQQRTLQQVMLEKGIKLSEQRGNKLATRLTGMKTRLNNRIESLKKQIELGARTDNTRPPIKPDADAKALQAEVARLESVMEDIERASGALHDKKESKALKSLDTSINKYLAMIEKGAVGPKSKEGESSTFSNKISDKQQLASALRAEVQEFRNERNMPKTTIEQKQLDALKRRVAKDTEEYQRRLDEEDYAPKKRAPNDVKLDKAAAAAVSKLNKLKAEYNRKNAKYQWDNSSLTHKSADHLLSIMDLSKQIRSSGEMSAVLRQGGLFAKSHPIKAAKAAWHGALAWGRSSKKTGQWEHHGEQNMEYRAQKLRERANHEDYKQYDIGLETMDGVRVTEEYKMHEQGIGAEISRRTPGLAASQRAYTTTLNEMRADLYDGLLKGVEKNGKAGTVKQKEIIAGFVRDATGRGRMSWKKGDQIVGGAGNVLWSPRLLLSRINHILKVPARVAGMASRDAGTRKVNREITKEYFRQGAGIIGWYALMAALTGKTPEEKNPLATMYGRLALGKEGNVKQDPLMGFGQLISFVARVKQGKRKKADGEIVAERGEDKPFGGRSTLDTMERFARSKAHPSVGTVIDLVAQEDFLGRPLDTNAKRAAHIGASFVPMAWKDMVEIAEEEGIPQAMIPSILVFMGESVQVWNDKGRKNKKSGGIPRPPSAPRPPTPTFGTSSQDEDE
jgi:hypothetical protein